MVDEPIHLTHHLEELRKRLMIAGGSWLLAFFACYSFAEPLFLYISEPLREALPESSSLVFLTATESFRNARWLSPSSFSTRSAFWVLGFSAGREGQDQNQVNKTVIA